MFFSVCLNLKYICIVHLTAESVQLYCGFRKLEGLDWWWFKGQLKSLLSPPPGSGLRGNDFLILTTDLKFLSHSSLHKTHAFLHCAEWPPMKYLTSELWVTEVSNPIYFILTARFCWTRDSFLSLYPSHFMVPWNSAREIIPQTLDILETQAHFIQAPKMSELPLWFLFLLFYLEHSPRCTVYPFYLLSLTAFFFFLVLSALWAHGCSLLLSLVAASLGCVGPCLSPRCCVYLVVLLIMHHAHNQEQTGPGLAT